MGLRVWPREPRPRLRDREGTAIILRHWDATYTPEIIRALPHFDAFVYQIDHGQADIAKELQAEGKIPVQYYNILTHPRDDWHGEWVDLVRAIVPPVMIPDPTGPQGERPAAAWGEGRKLWDWPLLDQGKLTALENQIHNDVLTRCPPTTRVFLDLAFFRARDWMYVPSSDFYTLDAARWVYQERRMRRFIHDLQRRGLATYTNGDRRDDVGPLYLEHANWDWERDVNTWHGNPDSVLSVDADDTVKVHEVVALGNAYPTKWIAFTGWNPDAVDEAYLLAAA